MTTQLLSFGTQITSPADELQPVSTQQVFDLLTNDASLRSSTDRLRKLAQLDKEAYRTIKTRLPYIVGSTFGGDQGVVRRTETFVAAHYFVLDLDNCPDLKGQVPDVVRANEQVELAFVSPSGQGLKLFFRLLEPCTDVRQFSAAYRNFATQLGVQYRWTSSIDLRTSDVTRACFLAHDPSAYHNSDAFPIDWRLWLPDADEGSELDLFADKSRPSTALASRPSADRPINEAAYRDVLRQIGGRSHLPVRREKQMFVPDTLRELEPAIRGICQQMNWELTEICQLNYGLKFAIRQGLRRAEINAFYGKKGFSLVRSPKTGTDPALGDLLYSQLFGLLFQEPVAADVLLTASVSSN